ncbi:tyrosine-type recombinase/integrase [Isoptericola sp. NPDC019571]|uniref:tyrosine-type recombinase/integrase n=1 Tax=Isoptericola sp. NPDC019571 TaxID=3364008 RepID=UPI0037AE4485
MTVQGESEELAVAALRGKIAALVERGVEGGLTPESEFRRAARMWLEGARMDAAFGNGRHNPPMLDRYEQILRRQVVPRLGRLRLSEVTVPEVEAAVYEIVVEGHPRKAQLFRGTVALVLDMCVRMEVVSDNAARESRKPRVPKKPSASASVKPAEIHAWRAAVRSWRLGEERRPGPRPDGLLPVIVDVMLGTGMRLDDVLALRWSDIHRARSLHTLEAEASAVMRGGATVDHATNSDAQGLPIVWPRFAFRAVMGLRPADPDPESFIFVSRTGRPLQPGNVRRSLRAALREAGIDHSTVHPHLLRSTVSMAIADGRTVAEYALTNLGESFSDPTGTDGVERRLLAQDVTRVLECLVDESEDVERRG